MSKKLLLILIHVQIYTVYIHINKDTQTYRRTDIQYRRSDRQIQRERHSDSRTAGRQSLGHKNTHIERQTDKQKKDS